MTTTCTVIAFAPRPRPQPMRRPRLLVRAARAGQAGWNRTRDLRRVLKCDDLPAAGMALARLLAEEERLDQARRGGQAGYDLHRHVMLLIAIMAETAEAAIRPAAAPLTCP
ncbi:hypothetical protein SAMN05421641_1256 [Paracoccus thiocyanatus]|uniref:Uncharacterized protein n=1 Tax=Paracoccus thiocyanatus TaxID=34006 RepID=A0A1N6Y676_9RHOB|nr:DUF6477 family protein [Paracoccus thiocyanatus]SIR10132.1 hypothetical protein SAMN05421641_1256 [Paracoccus thiocyanatus]